MGAKKLLSVIVPAYKQEGSIKEDLENIDDVLSTGLRGDYDYEILCVVDGSPDETSAEARKVKRKNVKVLDYKRNRGKGYAVRYGMNRAKGELISFLDAGREISPDGIMMLMAHQQWYQADIIVGSKRHPASHVDYPLTRKVLSTGYHFGVRLLFGIPVRDTQSGIKIFRRPVIRKVLPKCGIERYAMDIEILALAKHFGYGRIYEAPIEIKYGFGDLTHASNMKVIAQMLRDTLGLFYSLKIKRVHG